MRPLSGEQYRNRRELSFSHHAMMGAAMETIYELWDAVSRNLIAVYDSEDEALSAVRTFIEVDGEESIEGVALVLHKSDGSGNVIAADAALAQLAQERQRQSLSAD
jgi:hypothetical protein